MGGLEHLWAALSPLNTVVNADPASTSTIPSPVMTAVMFPPVPRGM